MSIFFLHLNSCPPPPRCVLSVMLLLLICFWSTVCWLTTMSVFSLLWAQLWLRGLQSRSRAPVLSCLAGQTSPLSGGWRRGGRRWAGSRRFQTCRRSGLMWGHNHRKDLASQVLKIWYEKPERKVRSLCQDYTIQGDFVSVFTKMFVYNHRPSISSSFSCTSEWETLSLR